MSDNPTIAVYNASAGAGKTFALVRDYLNILFRSSNDYKFRNILAITFTNKAVAEMKMRITQNLKEFSEGKISPMFNAIQETTGLEAEAIQKKAARLLRNIIQDYASFDVVTIDTFTHRIIRTFARDLKISQNFEVELNTEEVLNLAVDNLIDRAGSDPQLTPVLLDYALEKVGEDKSWDISKDFYDIAKLLQSENDRTFLKLLKERSLTDFVVLKEHLSAETAKKELAIKNGAKELLDYIADQGLETNHFSHGYLPKALIKFTEENFNFNNQTKWFQNLGEEELYTSKQKQHIKDIMDAVLPQLTERFLRIHALLGNYHLDKELLKKITPLSLLKAIDEEVQQLKAEKNLLLISDFNEVIHTSIAHQPTPFIYERLGERYHHYFIDEFQDTSILQWQNMIPLIDNAVSTGGQEEPKNSLMLVGDPKQAIYRWRGGYAEQFIALAAEHNPFQNPDKKTVELPTNWRSYVEIISFNNGFFTASAEVFEEAAYREIYTAGNNQRANTQTGGKVTLNFVHAQTIEEAEPLYLEEVLSTIIKTLASGFAKEDICILTRRKKEGIALARFLQEHGVAVISSESLLLAQSPEVNFIVNLLSFMRRPDAKTISIQLLEYLAKHHIVKNAHDFYVRHLPLDGQKFFDALAGEIPSFDLKRCGELPLYESVEYCIRYFELDKNGGAYLQFFLDAVFDFSEKNDSGSYGFLEWWEKQKDSLSISTPPGLDAIQIMTIHKAKGLEFPVVIYPFAESGLYPKTDSNWYQTDPKNYVDFKALLISQKKGLLDLDDQAAALYHAKRRQHQLDNLNVLYVALTRPIQELHIISRKTEKSQPADDPQDFAALFINYLSKKGIWEANKDFYRFPVDTPPQGNSQKSGHDQKISAIAEQLFMHSSSKESHDIVLVTQAERLWDEQRRESINMGNVLHDLMAGIKRPEDVQRALKRALLKGTLQAGEVGALEDKINSLLQELIDEGFFKKEHNILNERDLIFEGRLLRPDRVEIDQEGRAYLLDYKTGSPLEAHRVQISDYGRALKAIGHPIVKKLLVYVNTQPALLAV